MPETGMGTIRDGDASDSNEKTSGLLFDGQTTGKYVLLSINQGSLRDHKEIE